MRKQRILGWLLVFLVFGGVLKGCSNDIIPNTTTNADGIPQFITSTLVNATYLGGSSRSNTARYLDGQQVVGIRDHPEVTATFYNFGFWEGDEIELPQVNIRSKWHNNDYESNIRNATRKWIAEYSLYYLADGTAYCDCRYKLRVNAPLNGNYYCYSEVTYLGAIDISTLLQTSTTPVISDLETIAAAMKDSQIVATGLDGEYIVKVKETEGLLKIVSGIKDSMFVSIDPFPYVEDGYVLINVVPKFSEYRVLDPNIIAPDGNNYYAVVVKFISNK